MIQVQVRKVKKLIVQSLLYNLNLANKIGLINDSYSLYNANYAMTVYYYYCCFYFFYNNNNPFLYRSAPSTQPLPMEFSLQLQQSFQSLLQQPTRFNELSKQVIVKLSKIHNSHNRLLPADLVADIIDELYHVNPFENKKSSLKFAFSYNIVRHIVLSNFHDLKDNKVYAVIAMVYAEKLTQFYHEVIGQQKSLAIIKNVAQMTIINEITLKYAQRTKIFFPEYVKALKVTVDKLENSILRNVRHSAKAEIDAEEFATVESILNVAFSKETDKGQLIYILIGLFNFVLKQASQFFNTSPNKKEMLLLGQVEAIIESIKQLQTKLPENLKNKLSLPAEFKKYEHVQGQQNELKQDEPIYLEAPIQVRELTPRFYNEQQATQTKLLRKKRNKLEKKMQLQLKQSTTERLQERRVVEGVKKDKIQRQVKKEIFILQKQTEEAKKAYKQMKKVKTIRKESKGSQKGGQLAKLAKLGRKGKR